MRVWALDGLEFGSRLVGWRWQGLVFGRIDQWNVTSAGSTDIEGAHQFSVFPDGSLCFAQAEVVYKHKFWIGEIGRPRVLRV
jgi:hypothetical protein